MIKLSDVDIAYGIIVVIPVFSMLERWGKLYLQYCLYLVLAKMTVLKSGLIYVLGFCIFLFSVFVFFCNSFKFQI